MSRSRASPPCPPAGPGAAANNANNVFEARKMDFSVLLEFSQIPPSTREHLKRVYASLALCMLVAAAGAYVHVVTRLLQGGLASLLGSLGALLWLAATPHNHKTERKRLAILSAFAFCTGLGLGPVLDYVVRANPAAVPTAFLGTAAVFACFTLSALYAERRSYLYLGGVLMSGLCLLLSASAANLFLGSVALFRAHTVAGLLVFCGFVLFDTQLIIEKAARGDRDYVWHCVDLFLDFVTIFRKMMVLMAMNDKDKKKEKGKNSRDNGDSL